MDTEFLRRRWTCLCWTHTRRVSLLPEFRLVAKGTSWICIHCMCGHFILLQSSPNWGVDEKFGCCYREFAANRRNLKIESSYLSSFFHRPSWLLAVSPRSPAGEFSSNKFAKYLGGGASPNAEILFKSSISEPNTSAKRLRLQIQQKRFHGNFRPVKRQTFVIGSIPTVSEISLTKYLIASFSDYIS